MSGSTDKRVIACNLTEGVSEAREGALCYILDSNLDNAAERVRLLMRSHSGRWIRKWESLKRVGNFRLKTLPSGHPRYNDDILHDGVVDIEKHLGACQSAKARLDSEEN
jgi:hypothetical protein